MCTRVDTCIKKHFFSKFSSSTPPPLEKYLDPPLKLESQVIRVWGPLKDLFIFYTAAVDSGDHATKVKYRTHLSRLISLHNLYFTLFFHGFDIIFSYTWRYIYLIYIQNVILNLPRVLREFSLTLDLGCLFF